MTSLVLTLIGADRPGLVDALASLVSEHAGNWVESRMARLAGQFAGILRVDVPDERAAALRAALEALAGPSIRLLIEGPVQVAEAPARAMTLEFVGADHPGIVSAITRVLATHRVNIVELETECSAAPMSGSPLFRARAKLAVPTEVEHAALATALERIASDVMVDLELQA